MYQLFKSNGFRFSRDKVFWFMLVIFFLQVLFVTLPTNWFVNFTYTGTNESLRHSLNLFTSEEEEALQHIVWRSSMCKVKVPGIAIAYTLVFCAREKKGRIFEKFCAVSQKRVSVYLGDLISLITISLLFPLALCVGFTLGSIFGISIDFGETITLMPFLFAYLVFFAFWVIFVYSLYLLTKTILLPLILTTVFFVVSIFDTLSAAYPIVNKFVNTIGVDAHFDAIKGIGSWRASIDSVAVFILLSVFLILTTSLVIKNRDLD
ncbi:MAG: hypothetical protein J5752_09925 [Clostridiales bacterium]|nr:hypothetical protein [Clostridiales bacterium]